MKKLNDVSIRGGSDGSSKVRTGRIYRDNKSLPDIRSKEQLKIDAKQSYNDTKASLGMIGSVLSIILLLLLIVAVYRVASGMEPMLFTDFLHTIQDLPRLDVSLNTIGTITDDWGVFNFLRFFINSFLSGLNFLVFLGGMVINLIIFLGYVLSAVFVIV